MEEALSVIANEPEDQGLVLADVADAMVFRNQLTGIDIPDSDEDHRGITFFHQVGQIWVD